MPRWVLTQREPAPLRSVRLHYIVDNQARYAIVVREEAATEWGVALIGRALTQVHRQHQKRKR